MLFLDQTRVSRSAERRIANGVSMCAEGKALVAVYEGGELTVRPSTGAADEIFVGVAFSNITPIVTLNFFNSVTAKGTEIILDNEPIPSTLSIEGLTEGNASTAGQYSVDKNVITLNKAQANGVFDITYKYSPTALQSISKQGDVEPGQHITSVLGMTGVIESGDVSTSEYDPTADWTLNTVKLGADGTFTTGGSGVQVQAIVTRKPTAGRPLLGLSFTL